MNLCSALPQQHKFNFAGLLLSQTGRPGNTAAAQILQVGQLSEPQDKLFQHGNPGLLLFSSHALPDFSSFVRKAEPWRGGSSRVKAEHCCGWISPKFDLIKISRMREKAAPRITNSKFRAVRSSSKAYLRECQSTASAGITRQVRFKVQA